MAIKKSIDHKGLPAPEAYIRVEMLTGGKRRGHWDVSYAVYANAEKANPGKVKTGERQVGKEPDGAPIMEDVFQVPAPEPLSVFGLIIPYVAGADPHKQAYEAAKKHLEGGEDA